MSDILTVYFSKGTLLPEKKKKNNYMGLLTAPWKANNLVAILSPHQLSPPAKPTHRQPRCVFVLGRWGTNRALMEFEENIMYRDYQRDEVAALPAKHQVLCLWCAREHSTALWATALLMQRQAPDWVWERGGLHVFPPQNPDQWGRKGDLSSGSYNLKYSFLL